MLKILNSFVKTLLCAFTLFLLFVFILFFVTVFFPDKVLNAFEILKNLFITA